MLGLNGKLLDFIYPVGSYYETSDTSFNPNTAWGGTWLEDTKGRVTVAIDSEDTDFDTINETGGSKYLQGHKHATSWSVAGTGNKGQGYDGMPFYRAGNTTADSELMWTGYRPGTSDASGIKDLDNKQINVGNSGNLQPYVVVKRWHRTA